MCPDERKARPAGPSEPEQKGGSGGSGGGLDRAAAVFAAALDTWADRPFDGGPPRPAGARTAVARLRGEPPTESVLDAAAQSVLARMDPAERAVYGAHMGSWRAAIGSLRQLAVARHYTWPVAVW